MERLQKYLARAGVSSRRAAEQLILDGRVKVNGKVVTELGTKVDGAKDLVVMDGAPIVASNERQWYLFYKPPGVVTTMSDPQGRPTVGEYVERLEGRVFPVGRLDYDAEGALLLTDDGETANKLMHPKHQVPRVYLAKVKGNPDDESLEKLRGGVRLEDGMAKPTEVSRFEKAEKNTWLKIVVTEGRPHLVKRLCAAIGHPVVRLYRPQHAGIGVEGVKPGEFRALTVDEVRQVRAAGDGRGLPANELRLPARRHGHGAGSNDSPARPSGRAMSEVVDDDGSEPVSRGDTDAEAPRAPARNRERSASRQSAPRAPRRERAAPAPEVKSDGPARPFRAPRFGGAFKSRPEVGGPSRGAKFERPERPKKEFDPRRAPKPGAQGMTRGADRPSSSRPMKKDAPRDTGFRGRSATGDEGGGSFDTSPRAADGEKGSIHRGTSAGVRAASAAPGGYKGAGVATGGDPYSARKPAVKGAFGNKKSSGRPPPRGGGKGGFRGGR